MVKPLQIGVVPLLKPEWGGIYQYSLTMIEGLYEYSEHHLEENFTVFTNQPHPIFKQFPNDRWKIKFLTEPTLGFVIKKFLLRFIGDLQLVKNWQDYREEKFLAQNPENPITVNHIRFNRELDKRFKSLGIDYLIYPVWDQIAFETDIPFIAPIHDMMHQLNPELAGNKREWENHEQLEEREYVFRNCARFATRIFAESEYGKKLILDHYEQYGVTEERIKVLRLLPATYVDRDVTNTEIMKVSKKYKLANEYFFYPAQFWPHKNHESIIRGLAELRDKHNLELNVVFCGSYAGQLREAHYEYLKQLAKELKVDEQIKYLGFVPDEDMSALYAGSLALVMPTSFGPSNIPPLESWTVGRPVVTSNCVGIPEEMGDAAILVDPTSPTEVAIAMRSLYCDKQLREELIVKGRCKLAEYTRAHYLERLGQIISETSYLARQGQMVHRSKIIQEQGLSTD